MTVSVWIGIFGTLVALAYVLNSVRNLRASPVGHAANAARLHLVMVIAFVPVLWLIVVMKSL